MVPVQFLVRSCCGVISCLQLISQLRNKHFLNSDHVTGKYGNTFLVLSEGEINYGTCIQHFSLDNFSTIIDLQELFQMVYKMKMVSLINSLLRREL